MSRLRYLLIATVSLLAAGPALAKPAYTIVKSVPLGAPDRWDYVVFDPDSGRVYVAHGSEVAAVDSRTGVMIGRVTGVTGGTHGIAIAKAAGLGFTDDGTAGTAVAFNLDTFNIVKNIVANKDADALMFERATAHVFVVEGDPGTITVIDPASNAAMATIDVGEKMEYAAGDGDGVVYVAGEEKSDILKIDARKNAVVQSFSTPDCVSPHGLAFDKDDRRLFMGCVNQLLMVVDADTGRVVKELPIGRGSDAVAWDGERKRVFSSNGSDGTITIYQQNAPDEYQPLDVIQTSVSGRTMAVDPASGRLFVAAAETDPSVVPGGRPKARPGTLRLLFLDPIR